MVFNSVIHYPALFIKEGETTFISGDSGCGKTTLLRLFNNSATPDSGKIMYNGVDISQMDTINLRREVMLAGQSVYLFEGSIRDNFKEYYGYRDMTPPDDERITALLNICCANFPLETQCVSMSGGERQRVFIAIFLSFNPRVLLLDEPTSALDFATSCRLMENLKGYCRGRSITLAVVSHDRELSSRFADSVVTLKREGS